MLSLADAEIIREHLPELIDNIKNDPVRDELFRLNVLTRYDVEEITAESTNSRKNRKMLDIIVRGKKDDKLHLIAALRRAEQTHLVDLLVHGTAGATTNPLTGLAQQNSHAVLVDLLTKHNDYLLRKMDSKTVADKLFAKGILSRTEYYDEIMKIADMKDRNRRLLGILTESEDPKTLEEFINALKASAQYPNRKTFGRKRLNIVAPLCAFSILL